MALSLSDVLVRYIVRPTRGMMEGGHEKNGVLDYVRFAFSLGARGTLLLARRFFEANRALFSLWRDHVGRMAKRSRREHERRMRRLSVAYQISVRRLRALVRLQRKPATASLGAIATSLMLDRLALGTLGGGRVVTLFAFREHWTCSLPSDARGRASSSLVSPKASGSFGTRRSRAPSSASARRSWPGCSPRRSSSWATRICPR